MGMAATAALARAGFPLYGAASPVLVLVHRFLKPDGEPFVERTVKLLALASVWAYWSAGVAYLLLYVLFQLPLTSYHALVVVGSFAAGPFTGGAMNPARALGPAIAFWNF